MPRFWAFWLLRVSGKIRLNLLRWERLGRRGLLGVFRELVVKFWPY